MSQKGFNNILILVAGFLVVIGLLIFNKFNFKTEKNIESQTTPKPSSVESTPSASPSPYKSIKPTINPTSAYSVTSSDNCIIQSNAERMHPPAYYYFTVSLEKGNASSIKSVEWDNGNGVIDSTQTSINYGYTYKDFGNYIVRARVKLADGTKTPWCSKKAEVQLLDVKCEIHPNPSSGKAPLAVSLNTDVTADSSDGDIVGYQWDFNGDGNWDTSFNDANSAPMYTFQEPKTYTVKLQVKSKSGRISDICTATVAPN